MCCMYIDPIAWYGWYESMSMSMSISISMSMDEQENVEKCLEEKGQKLEPRRRVHPSV